MSNEPSSASTDVTPRELDDELRRDAPPLLIDVREPVEWDIARLPGAHLVPLATLPDAASTLDPAADIVVYCHHGARSDAAARWLRDAGFSRVRNLTGGIDRWSREVDDAVPRY